MGALDEIFRRELFGIKLGLGPMRRLCAALGDPQLAYPTIIVAGTNGKGSVAAITAAALTAAGLRTGRYTSPHLVRLNERVAVDGRAAEDEALEDAASAVVAAELEARARGAIAAPMTFFELTTATAFEYFRRARVDVAVVEVGMGGRYDATNVGAPVAAAITSIDLDHTAHLGDTLEKIAFEKAGVVRHAMPVVTGAIPVEPLAVIAMVAAEHHVPLIEAEADVATRTALDDEGRTRLWLRTPRREYGPLTLALRGAHQVRNALVAVRLLEALDEAGPLRVPAAAIERGLTEARWPGRLDLRRTADGRAVLLDAAHNPAGAAALASYLRDAALAPLPIVFGVMGDKDATPMLEALAPVASTFVFTQAGTRRARPASELPALLPRKVPHEVVPDAVEALARAWQLARRVCACGSIFLIGDLLRRADLGPPAA